MTNRLRIAQHRGTEIDQHFRCWDWNMVGWLNGAVRQLMMPWPLASRGVNNHGSDKERLHGDAWWRHQMETFFAFITSPLCREFTGREFPSQRPVTRSFGVFFDLRLNKGLSKQSSAGDLRRYRADYDVTVMDAAIFTQFQFGRMDTNLQSFTRQV